MLDGFVIVGLNSLQPEIANYIVENHSDKIISTKEVVAMYTSSVNEIVKGDQSEKSLNVKLYRCLAEYATDELDLITKRNP